MTDIILGFVIVGGGAACFHCALGQIQEALTRRHLPTKRPAPDVHWDTPIRDRRSEKEQAIGGLDGVTIRFRAVIHWGQDSTDEVSESVN